jgi:hypothetical protein
MTGVGASMGAHGELTGEGKEGEGKELPWEPMDRGLGAAWGAARAAGGHHGEGLRAACVCLVLCSCAVRENRKQEGEEEKEEREKKKKRGKKKKIWKKFQTCKFSGRKIKDNL